MRHDHKALTPNGFVKNTILNRLKQGPVSHAELVELVYGSSVDGPKQPNESIRCHISQMRTALGIPIRREVIYTLLPRR